MSVLSGFRKAAVAVAAAASALASQAALITIGNAPDNASGYSGVVQFNGLQCFAQRPVSVQEQGVVVSMNDPVARLNVCDSNIVLQGSNPGHTSFDAPDSAHAGFTYSNGSSSPYVISLANGKFFDAFALAVGAAVTNPYFVIRTFVNGGLDEVLIGAINPGSYLNVADVLVDKVEFGVFGSIAAAEDVGANGFGARANGAGLGAAHVHQFKIDGGTGGNTVPEPGSVVLTAAALAALAAARRRTLQHNHG